MVLGGTAMKAEDFVEKYLKDNNMDFEDTEFIHVLDIMEQYANEVSREKQKTAFGAGRRYESYLRTKAKRLNTPHYMPNFDVWLKEQEEK